jgi:signal transduction histidine kinase
MLDASRIQQKEPAELKTGEFDICELLRLTLITFEAKALDRRLDVDVALPEESMTVRGDADGYTQVMYNLLDNAVKFSEEGSTISLSLWKQGRKAYVSVKSRGETIAESELPLIFDRFHKTDRSRSADREGVGLGLYLVKTILSGHDEDIIVTSRDGYTEFVFTLTLK